MKTGIKLSILVLLAGAIGFRRRANPTRPKRSHNRNRSPSPNRGPNRNPITRGHDGPTSPVTSSNARIEICPDLTRLSVSSTPAANVAA